MAIVIKAKIKTDIDPISITTTALSLMLAHDSEDFRQVEQLLGRKPQGLEEIMCRDTAGMPSVIRARSIVNGKPFPTLFWLVDKRLCYIIDGLEARGTIQEIQQELNRDPNLQAQFTANHLQHIALRDSYMSDELKVEVEQRGYRDLFAKRGIGGISLEIQVPPDFPEQYKEAVIRSAELCAVKKHLHHSIE